MSGCKDVPGWTTGRESTELVQRPVSDLATKTKRGGPGSKSPLWSVLCHLAHYSFCAQLKPHHSTCQACPTNTWKANAGNEACTAATECQGNDQETTILTPTSDRKCTRTLACTNGIDDNGDVCECPGGDSCETCFLQPAYVDVLLVSSGSVPRSEPVDSNAICVDTVISSPSPTETDYRRACRDLCNVTATCDSFFVFVRSSNADLQGDCCMTKK